MKDDSTLFSRLKRYAQVSTAVTNLASKIAGEKYLGIDINRDQHAKDLQQLLGGLKGPLMKIGQFLATVPGALPPEYAEELLQLQSNAPSMGWSFVRRRMANELGQNWKEHFSHFSETAAAAASLGQVHKATLSSGEIVACKLQYPDMESTIDADLGQLNLILSAYNILNNAIDTTNIKDEIAERLREELDYYQESQNIKIYGHIFKDDPCVTVPTVYESLSTNRLLTMSWMEGTSALSFETADQVTRNQIAKRLFHAWYYPLYHYAIIHGDPHPGNYKIKENKEISLLDMGCIRIFPNSFIQGVIDLYYGLLHDKKDQVVHAYEQWGFTNLSQEIINIITEWAQLLYDPLLDDRIRPIQKDLQGKVGWDTATKVHEQLNKTSGISPPKEFVFMDRAAVGIGSVMMRLKAEQNWYQLFNQLIENFSCASVEANQKKALGIKKGFCK